MSIYISYHPLDYDFAFELIIYLRNRGFDTQLCHPHLHESLDQRLVKKDTLVAILRPEYLRSADYSTLVNLIEIVSVFLPVLRVPISVDDWSSNKAFCPVADFTNRDKRSIDLNLNLFNEVLAASSCELPSAIPTPEEIYLNNLEVTLRTLHYPISLLERINYECDPEAKFPIDHLIDKTQFRIGTRTSPTEWQDAYFWNRKDSLNNIVEYYKYFVMICTDVDCSVMAYYLIDMARRRAIVDKNAPTPVLLDVENWDPDIDWVDWLRSQVSFSDTPIEDIATGKCAIYAHGLGSALFKTHPLKSTFEQWLHGTSPPRFFIIQCKHIDTLDDYLLTDIIITPVESDLIQLHQIGINYKNRPFGQFLVQSTENRTCASCISFLARNPIFATMLLSVHFDTDVDFDQLSISDYYQILIKNLWYIATCRNHEDQTNLTEVINPLLKLAALSTEQQKTGISRADIFSLISSESIIAKCSDAGFFSITDQKIRFSMPIIQEYFAAKALLDFGIPARLPNLALDKQFRRVPQRWDKSIIICSHLSSNKDEVVKRVAKADPILALLCIVSGVTVSPSIYSFVIEQNLNSLITLGDFRIDFAALLYHVDSHAAKSIFLEILRDAHWPIRLNAFIDFIEMERTFLPGLAEAIEDLRDNTRNQVAQAIHRLGSDALSTLFTLLRKDNAKLRLNAAWALGELRDKASVPALIEILRDNDLDVSKQVIASLAILQDINCVPYLVQYLHTRHPSIRRSISTSLAYLQHTIPSQFASIVRKMDASAKRLVILTLSGSATNNLVDLLLELSHDENVEVRMAAIIELGAYSETRVISRLEACLDDMSKSRLTKSTVGEIVSKVLSKIQTPEAKSAVLIKPEDTADSVNSKLLKSSEIVKARLLNIKETRMKEIDLSTTTIDHAPMKPENVSILPSDQGSTITDDLYVSAILEQLRERTWTNSNNAAKILREYVKGLHGNASLNVINQILETLNDADWVIRWTGVETLGWIGNVYVVPHLVQRLTDSNWKIRIAAIRTLSEIGDNTAVAGLSVLLSDSNSVVREAAAEALGFLDGQEALRALESAAVDHEDFVRLAAVESLGRIRQRATLETLLVALKDKSEHVRWAAANGLVAVANAETVSSLLPSLSDTAGPYWEQKRICDVIVDILKQIGTKEALDAVAGWRNSEV